MTQRITEKFEALKKEKRSGLITYIMGGDPDENTSLNIMKGLPKAGADIIELGFPFTDPMADGPVIQKAASRALNSGMTLVKVLDMVKRFRDLDETTPVILMGYFNPILHYGIEDFVFDAVKAGVDGLLIVDLPPEEDMELFALAEKSELALIKLTTPTTDDARAKTIFDHASGFIYHVSITGVTGAEGATPEVIGEHVENLREHTKLPIAVGFGIKNAKQVKDVSSKADAVVVGSSIVNVIGESVNQNAKVITDSVHHHVKKLATGLR